MKRFLLAALALVSSHKAFAATVTGAATAGIAAETSTHLGSDPIAWGIGAAGATVVFAYKKADTIAKIIANGFICLFLGGLLSPYIGYLILTKFHIDVPQYVLAGVLSAGWPWVLPIIIKYVLNLATPRV